MAKFDLKKQAIHLRKSGLSINEISKQLKVSKSTSSLWCRRVGLTPKQKFLLRTKMIKAGMRGRLKGSMVNRLKKEEVQKVIKEEVGSLIHTLTKRDKLMLLVALYWGEGAKTSSKFLFVNSDPEMILLVKNILTELFLVKNGDIYVTLQINRIHEKREKEIISFWSNKLKIPKDQFSKTYYINVLPKKRYKNESEYKGIIRMRVARGSKLQYKMLSLIKRVAEVAQVVRAVVS